MEFRPFKEGFEVVLRLKMMEMDERGCKTWLKDEREWV